MMSNFTRTNEDEKPTSKVMRPPGGGSSDIFGSDVPSTPRNVKNHMQSNIFSCEKGFIKNNGEQSRRGQRNVDSYTRLFGHTDRPITPANNHMKSSIPFGGDAVVGNGNGYYSSKNKNGKSETGGSSSSSTSSVSSSTENLKINGLSKIDGNPVTGEGYKPAGAEISTSIPSLNGANQVINKNRIPPGGFSSGLW